MARQITVVETRAYLSDADYAGMNELDRAAVVDELALQPDGGVSLGGGLYKIRVARAGGGKSGGWRVLAAF